MHCNWRDTKAWKDEGLELSTLSNEAAKLYDASLTQYVSWYEEPTVGGIEKSITDMLAADPNFVMGHVISNGLDLMGTGRSLALDPTFKSSLEAMKTLVAKSKLNEREALHVEAINKLADGYMKEATEVWENILLDYPTDILALRFAHDSYFYLGYQQQMRDSLARVFPFWKASMPHYGHLYGMYSFGLVETYNYEEAERVALKGLELNRQDTWSTHSVAHVFEMTGRQKDGISFMSSTVNDWAPCGLLACHNFWHWALYHIEKGEYQGAIDLYDSEIGQRVKSGAMLDIVDACSLLYRLEMEGVNVGDRWEDLFEICRPHVEDHILAFNDVHILMACLGAKQKETTQKMMTTLEDFVREGKGTNRDVFSEVGHVLCKAFVAYDEAKYDEATDLLENLRYKFVHIGGSNAQRDIFNLFLIQAAIKSPKQRHKKLARSLLSERKALKECAPMTDRMMAALMAEHHHE